MLLSRKQQNCPPMESKWRRFLPRAPTFELWALRLSMFVQPCECCCTRPLYFGANWQTPDAVKFEQLDTNAHSFACFRSFKIKRPTCVISWLILKELQEEGSASRVCEWACKTDYKVLHKRRLWRDNPTKAVAAEVAAAAKVEKMHEGV